MTTALWRLRPTALLALALMPGVGLAAQGADPRLGERIYRDGLNARGEPVRALVGLPPVPLTGAKAACGACHALTSPPSSEPRTDAAPDLEWSALAGNAAEKGSTAPYSEAAFARAVSEGIVAGGGLLSAAMPRYALSRSEIAALAAYLRSRPTEKKSR